MYVAFQRIGLALGVVQPGSVLADLGQALAYSLPAAGIWLYQGT